MRINRVVSVAVILGLLIVVVTFVGAAKLTGEENIGKDGSNSALPVSSASRVVVFGYVDIDNGAGLLHLFPNTFPQPCKVAKIHVKEGQDVKKDDLLIEFEDPQSDFKIQQARAGLQKAQAALACVREKANQAGMAEQAQKIAISVQEDQVKSKEALLKAAQIELEKQQKDAERLGAGNDAGLRAAKEKWDSANHDLAAEKRKTDGLKRVNPIPSRIKEAEEGVKEAAAAVALQQSLLDQAEDYKKQLLLKAPSDGRIAQSHATEGLWFGAQSRMAAFEFLPKGQIIVRAEVDQEWASRVTQGQNAKIQDDSNPELKWTGKVIHVSDCFLPKRSNSAVPDVFGGSETRILECIVSIEKVDPKAPLRVGQKLKVSIGFD